VPLKGLKPVFEISAVMGTVLVSSGFRILIKVLIGVEILGLEIWRV
jgi:hypothetical protein